MSIEIKSCWYKGLTKRTAVVACTIVDENKKKSLLMYNKPLPIKTAFAMISKVKNAESLDMTHWVEA
jgi:hypothetical protein